MGDRYTVQITTLWQSREIMAETTFLETGMVALSCNASTWEVKARQGRFGDQPGIKVLDICHCVLYKTPVPLPTLD